MADVAVVGLRGGVSGRRCKSMGGVVVVNRNGVAVRIVSPGMRPVERAAADDHGKHGGQCATQHTITPSMQPHSCRLYPSSRRAVNARATDVCALRDTRWHRRERIIGRAGRFLAKWTCFLLSTRAVTCDGKRPSPRLRATAARSSLD